MFGEVSWIDTIRKPESGCRKPPSGTDESLPARQDGAGHPIKGAGELGHGREAAFGTSHLPAAADVAAQGDRARWRPHLTTTRPIGD
jgi:hypothetical protein